MFYTDLVTNQILVANIDGTGSQVLMEDDLEVPGTKFNDLNLNLCLKFSVVSSRKDRSPLMGLPPMIITLRSLCCGLLKNQEFF